jgi:hypothetical protein
MTKSLTQNVGTTVVIMALLVSWAAGILCSIRADFPEICDRPRQGEIGPPIAPPDNDASVHAFDVPARHVLVEKHFEGREPGDGLMNWSRSCRCRI